MLGQGIDVRVYAPTVEKPAISHEGTLVPAPSIPIPGRSEYRLSTGMGKRIRRDLNRFKPDIIHIATPDVLGMRARKYAMRHRVSLVSSFHTHFVSYMKYYKMERFEEWGWKYLRWFYKSCNHIYVPTEGMLKELENHGIKDNLKIWARGVDISTFNPQQYDANWRKSLNISDDQRIVLFVSRLVWEKDLLTYARVVQRLKPEFPEIVPVIVGEGPAGKELKKMLPDARFTGFLKGNELARAYAGSDVFLFPSDTETFGNVILEAMACGVPPVVADAAGSKSLVEFGENGYLAEAANVESFSAYVKKLLQDDSCRTEMGKKARFSASNHSWNRVNGQLLNYYKETLS